MKQILLFLSLVFAQSALSAQVKTAGVNYSVGAPAWIPSVNTASELAIDTVSKRIYLWNRNTGAWDMQGRGVDQTSGSTPPAYTPNQTDSYLALNNASPPELYAWTGSAWAKVAGTVQTIDTFSVSGSIVSLSLSGDAQPAKTITLPSAITSLNSQTGATQTFATGTTGTDVGIVSSANTHTFNFPNASASARGLLTSADWSTFNGKVGGSGTSGQVGYFSGTNTLSGSNNLFWDNTNGRLGIGTNAPTDNFHVIASAGTNPRVKIGDADITNPFSSIEGTSSTIGVLEMVNASGGGLLHRGYSVNSTTPGLVFLGLTGSNTPTASSIEFRAGKLSGTTFAPLGSTEIAYNFRNNDATQSYFNVLGSGNFGIGVSPSARLHVQGAGSTSATWTAQFHNSTGTNNALMVRDDGRIGFGTSTLDETFNFNFSQNGNTNIRVTNPNAGTSTRPGVFAGAAGASIGVFSCLPGYTPVASYAGRGIISTEGGLPNGLLFRAPAGNIELQSGGASTATITSTSFLIGTTTEAASAVLNVTSTTKGFLPPRMTATQASAIASPAEGLMVYVTNTNGTFLTKGWYGYNGAAWEKLNN